MKRGTDCHVGLRPPRNDIYINNILLFPINWALLVEGPKGCAVTAWVRNALSAATRRE